MTKKPELPPLYGQAGSLLRDYWGKSVGQLTDVSNRITDAAPDLLTDVGKERHRIYCYLLMKVIHRFWNGNKRGPVGKYPLRESQKLLTDTKAIVREPNARCAEGELDRYLGHNIACIAVDGNGHIIDFEFRGTTVVIAAHRIFSPCLQPVIVKRHEILCTHMTAYRMTTAGVA